MRIPNSMIASEYRVEYKAKVDERPWQSRPDVHHTMCEALEELKKLEQVADEYLFRVIKRAVGPWEVVE